MILNPGYLASDESMFIPSDTSDISDWECVAGGFFCRDMVRDRTISESLNNPKHSILIQPVIS